MAFSRSQKGKAQDDAGPDSKEATQEMRDKHTLTGLGSQAN